MVSSVAIAVVSSSTTSRITRSGIKAVGADREYYERINGEIIPPRPSAVANKIEKCRYCDMEVIMALSKRGRFYRIAISYRGDSDLPSTWAWGYKWNFHDCPGLPISQDIPF
jgi:hypothetical protein